MLGDSSFGGGRVFCGSGRRDYLVFESGNDTEVRLRWGCDSKKSVGRTNGSDGLRSGCRRAKRVHDARGNLTFDGVYYYKHDYRSRLCEVYRRGTLTASP